MIGIVGPSLGDVLRIMHAEVARFDRSRVTCKLQYKGPQGHNTSKETKTIKQTIVIKIKRHTCRPNLEKDQTSKSKHSYIKPVYKTLTPDSTTRILLYIR